MWSRIDEQRQRTKQVQPFGLASTGHAVNPARVGSQSLHEWQPPDIASKECPVHKIGALNEAHAERQHSLHASQGSGAVELSPLDHSFCLESDTQERLDKPGMSKRLARMAEQPQHQAKPRKYFLRTKESELARVGSIPQRASLAESAQPSQSGAVPTSHGLTSAPGQLQPTRRIPDLFRAKRPSHCELPHTSKKACVRPSLSAALCSTPFGQELAARKHDFYPASTQMASLFDAPCQHPEELSQENVATCDMMKADDMVYCDEACDMMPCGMAPMPHSPEFNSEPVGFATGHQMGGAGNFTPDGTNQASGRTMWVSPSVHTPPECMAVVLDLPPGAPRKRTKSGSSTMSADSFDACESVFAPGAPDWSPCSAVCRVLRFGDEMDE